MLYPLFFILSRELVNQAMDQEAFHRAIYVTGPTASGKTAVGVALARRLGAEILALDSMTLYRGMDIGTAKPRPAEQCGIPHHLIDMIDPWESSSVSQYREWARKAVDVVEGQGRRALFVGGTALYLKTLLRGLFEGPGADAVLRKRLEQDAVELGDIELHHRLTALDPATAARLHFHDRRRIIRALEVFELTGKPISTLQAEHDQPAPAAVQVYALELPRASLHDRINRRVLGFFELGLVDEVRRLQAAERPLCPVAAEGIGYREVIAMLAGQASLTETIERVQARSRQFAKRQATWFRGLAEVRSVPVAADEDPDSIASRIAAMIEARSYRSDSAT
jgi:tRNA dimethylallyltransferase